MTTRTQNNINKIPVIDLDLGAGAAKNKRVVVAMSGGVDSSVAAALVKRAGYETIGITLQLYDHGEAVRRKGSCCAGQDVHDARQVSSCLDIPHYVLDYESRFKQSVMDDFADTYLAGHTPIPCVRCNETVKFRDLLATARELGADALVTGHYIKTCRVQENGQKKWQMYRPVDEARDQSYFLFSTTQEQLDFLRFPLAGLTKDEIRAYAKQIGLVTADKPDSQDICFVPTGDYASVIRRLRPDCNLPGEIVDMDGQVLGQHQGVLHYTVGQRRGLGLSFGAPVYVVQIDALSRRVVVGPRAALAKRVINLKDVNWLGDAGVGIELSILARIRSTTAPQPATLILTDCGGGQVLLSRAEEGVSCGQACVFYGCGSGSAESGRVLGGGWIVDSFAS